MGSEQLGLAVEVWGGLAFEAAQEAFLVVDEAGTILKVNRAGERIFGYDSAAIVGRSIGVLGPPATADWLTKIATRPAPPGDVRLRTSLGRAFSASMATVQHGRYRLVSFLPLAGDDQAERRLGMICEGLPDAFALWNPESRLVLCNARYRELYEGVSDIIVPGVLYEDFLRELLARRVFTPDPMDTVEEWIRVRLRGHTEAHVTVDEQTADGRTLRIHTRRTPDGYVVGMYTDITLFKRREELLIEKEAFYRSFADELIAARERLKEQTSRLAALAETQYAARERAEAASLAKSQFLASMSHELRTPLNAILGFSEMLQMEAFGPLGADKYREYASDIHTSGRHLLALINDVLDMSKIEAGKYELNLEACALDTLVAESVRIVEGRAIEAGVTIVNRVGDLPTPLRADPRATKQCLINLLANGVKFTPRGGSVSVDAEMDAAYVRIRVSDTGVGIPDEDLPRITEPFVQSKSGRKSWNEGTGLGLALTKSLVEMHRGSLAIRSSVGRGTVVTVTLPVNGPGSPVAQPLQPTRRLGAIS